MEFVPLPSGGGWRRVEAQCKTWQQGGLDMHTPTRGGSKSSYRRLLAEVENKSGVFATESWNGSPYVEPYVPPWRQTIFDVYGAEAAKKMKAPIESYEARASRFAREEAARRTGGSRAKLMTDLAD